MKTKVKRILFFLLIVLAMGAKCFDDNFIGYDDSKGKGYKNLLDNNDLFIRIVYLYQDPDEDYYTYSSKKNKLSSVFIITSYDTNKDIKIIDIYTEVYKGDNIISFKKINFYRDSVKNSDDNSFTYGNKEKFLNRKEELAKEGTNIIEFVYPVLKNKKLILKYKINLMHGDKEYLFEDTVELHYTD